jgi:hypothetical protein
VRLGRFARLVARFALWLAPVLVELPKGGLGFHPRTVGIVSGRVSPAGNGILHRIETGNFGHCIECGDEIAVGRLQNIPTVVKCLDCAADTG